MFYHIGSDITIGKLNLWGMVLPNHPTIQCKVEELRISGNHIIGGDPALYNMLSNQCPRLLTLYLSDTELSVDHLLQLLLSSMLW